MQSEQSGRSSGPNESRTHHLVRPEHVLLLSLSSSATSFVLRKRLSRIFSDLTRCMAEDAAAALAREGRHARTYFIPFHALEGPSSTGRSGAQLFCGSRLMQPFNTWECSETTTVEGT